MRFWNGPALLILDELGYLSRPAGAASHLFQVVSRRYEHGSIILTINRGIVSWGEIFDDQTCSPPVLTVQAACICSSGRSSQVCRTSSDVR
jgi:DNA replication protein DnaC